MPFSSFGKYSSFSEIDSHVRLTKKRFCAPISPPTKRCKRAPSNQNLPPKKNIENWKPLLSPPNDASAYGARHSRGQASVWASPIGRAKRRMMRRSRNHSRSPLKYKNLYQYEHVIFLTRCRRKYAPCQEKSVFKRRRRCVFCIHRQRLERRSIAVYKNVMPIAIQLDFVAEMRIACTGIFTRFEYDRRMVKSAALPLPCPENHVGRRGYRTRLGGKG